jgi:putative pyruvate formate lyase activating enzyme
MTLEHYYAVGKKEALPAFMKSRSIEVDFSADEDYDKLFLLHDSLLSEAEKTTEYSPKQKSLLDLKIHLTRETLRKCGLCERNCLVDREEKRGFCGVGINSHIASMFPHMGEEEMLVPSGTVFYTGCTFRCVFCQNWDISQFPERGVAVPPENVAKWLESENVINANFVGGEPTPNLYHILQVMRHLRKPMPMIWNSNMYMSERCMKLLNGAIDLYLSDFKYGNDECAMKYSSAPNYVKIVKRNHLIAEKHADLLVRHLVMPNHVECCSYKVLEMLKGMKALVNVMSQYRPDYKACEFPEINRRLRGDEYEKALNRAKELGLEILTQRAP